MESSGTKIHFASASNGIRTEYLSAPVGFMAGRWHQIALSYSPSNVALYFNGLAMTNQNLLGGEDNTRPYSPTTNYWINSAGPGIYNYPPPDIRAVGITIGCDWGGAQQAKGQFEELETFNYPLTPQQIARDFPNFNGAAGVTNDFDYDGRSDILEAQVDGTATNDASAVMGGRLGYWRFNDPITSLFGEALQAPLSTNGISVTPGWSSNALVISSTSTSGLIYRDVETNGWANFNCRYGAVRFWFRPGYGTGGPGADAPFLYMGSAASPNNGQWELGVSSDGKAVKFITASNAAPVTLMTANVDLTSNRWHQLAFNYGPNNLSLYVNGALVTNLATGLSKYPALVYRLEGLAIGNSTARNRPVNGQLDELETFNRQLTATEIQRSFDAVKATDDNLNGTVDLLEDAVLSNPVPFAGFPFVITGTMEAEQFDRGGEGVSYHSLGGNTVTNDYRPSAMQILTNTTDKGAGFLVDNLRAGEWLKYTLDVRVGQNYAVDVRVSGLGTGGVFHIEFATNATSAAYTNTGPITVGTTNWTNLVRTLLPLRTGTNLMKVVMDTNSASGKVCQLNYLSIYPSWIEGATNLTANVDVTGLTANDSSWTAATNNAARIQAAIDSLSTTGTVTILSGTYYLAQKSPIEAINKDAEHNTAVFVSKSNLKIQGAGKTNTILVAHNRATTLLYLGRANASSVASVTNVSLSSVTLEARPHFVAIANSGSGGFTDCWEDGFIDPASSDLGSLLLTLGANSTDLIRNTLVTNCLFRNASVVHFAIPAYVRDIAFRNCDFVMREGTNGALYFRTNSTPCHTNASVPAPWTGVSVLVRASGCENLLMLDCMFNGNPSMTSVNTNYTVDAADGIFWGQQGGNWFVGRCAITNYGLEGVQFGAGPAAVTGNEFQTKVSLGATCGLFAFPYWPTPTGATNDQTFYLVGNNISGGRAGYKGAQTGYGTSISDAAIHVSGNALALFPAFSPGLDAYGAIGGAVVAGDVRQGLVSGNVMVAGERGVWWLNGCASSVLLKNDFGSASYQGLTYSGTNGPQHHFVILRNTLNQGHRFHLQTTGEDARSYFFGENVFKAGTNTVSPFIVPIAAPVHFR